MFFCQLVSAVISVLFNGSRVCEITTPATSETNGVTTYTASFDDNEFGFETQTKDVANVPAADTKETSDPQEPVKIGIYGDVDGAGKATASDALNILGYTVNLKGKYPIGEPI